MAVSSESLEHKKLRFSSLSNLFIEDEKIEVHDVGMGLAAFYDFLTENFPKLEIEYSGSDILEEYVNECKKRYKNLDFYLRDLAEDYYEDNYDYIVMSGVFHQRKDSSIPEWENFYRNILKNAFVMANKGIAFNFVTQYVDFYQNDSYYCDISKLLGFITTDLSRFFQIKHDYPLFEFTVFVYKEAYIYDLYPQNEFKKYFKIP